MTKIKLNWLVPGLDTLIGDGFDAQKIEVENPPATWTEITRPHSRLPLVADVERYIYESSSDITYNFRAVPHRTIDDVDDTPIAITDKELRGYCSIQDMRDEGYGDVAYPDARVQSAIDRAVAVIDRVCGQRFDAYFARVKLNVKKNYDEHHIDVPIAALWKITDGGSEIDLSDILVYNRHLTEGLTNPDDRSSPMIAWGSGRSIAGIESIAGGRFLRGRKELSLWGVWGFTEIGPDEDYGVTAEGSQIPLSYGSTPYDIRVACMILTSGYLPTLSSGGDTSSLQNRITSEKTRDQSYTLAEISDEESAFGMTGNQQVDSILMRYIAPMAIGAV